MNGGCGHTHVTEFRSQGGPNGQRVEEYRVSARSVSQM